MMLVPITYHKREYRNLRGTGISTFYTATTMSLLRNPWIHRSQVWERRVDHPMLAHRPMDRTGIVANRYG